MMKIIKGVVVAIFSCIGKCFSAVSGWCLLVIQGVGISVGYIVCFLLLGAGAAGVLTNEIPLKLASFGITLIVARVFGIVCLPLGGFLLAHVVRADAEIRARQIAEKNEKLGRELKETAEKLGDAEKELARKDGVIAGLEKSIVEKDAKILAARTVNFASVKDVLKLFLLNAELTIYDFDNDKNMAERPLEVAELIGLGHHRLRSQWQYIGFREEKIKAIFGVDLNELHLEMRKDSSSGEDVLYVYGVKATHAVEKYTPMHQFSMLRKIYLQECKINSDDPVCKQRLANMEVFKTKDDKVWEVVKGKNQEYTCSRDRQELADAIARQEARMLEVRNGINRTQFKALDDQVIKRSIDFLKVFLSPVCKRIEISISDDKPTDWNRIETLPRLQEFCENYNREQMRRLTEAHSGTLA